MLILSEKSKLDRLPYRNTLLMRAIDLPASSFKKEPKEWALFKTLKSLLSKEI